VRGSASFGSSDSRLLIGNDWSRRESLERLLQTCNTQRY
jgi:hypothetical protein